MATYTTYDSVGQAEDVSNIITDISPTDCPFYSGIRTENISARIHEWQEDSRWLLPTTKQSKAQMPLWQLCLRPRSAPTTRKSSPKRSRYLRPLTP